MENATAAETTPPKTQGSAVKVIIPWVLFFVLLIGVGAFLYKTKMSKEATSSTPTAKICQGVNIVFFPGGNQKDPFASIVYNGAKAAETALGAHVQYVWSDWDSDKMVSQFKDAIDTSPDAIAIMGHPGADKLGALVDEAERKNILVTLQNVDIQSIREKYINKGFGYVGQVLYNSGLLVSNGVLRKYQPKEGTEAIVFGVDPTTDPSRYERTKGAVDGLKKGNLIVHEITISLDIQKDTKSKVAEKMIADALLKYPNTKIIITDHGALTSSVPTLLQNLGKKPGEYIVAGFDLTVDGIRSGYVGLVQDQQPYLQGFLPIVQSCLTKKYGFAGLYVDTGVGLIDSTNVELVASLAKQGIR